MPVNRLKPFTAALAGVSLLATGMAPVASHAESLQDVFTQQELDILFGEGAQIPKYIGPHRLVMSLEEAQQIEGEAFPVVPVIIIGIGAGFGALGAHSAGRNPIGGALIGGMGGAGGVLFRSGALALGMSNGGVRIATATGSGLFGAQGAALTSLGGGTCLTCHQEK